MVKFQYYKNNGTRVSGTAKTVEEALLEMREALNKGGANFREYSIESVHGVAKGMIAPIIRVYTLHARGVKADSINVEIRQDGQITLSGTPLASAREEALASVILRLNAYRVVNEKEKGNSI